MKRTQQFLISGFALVLGVGLVAGCGTTSSSSQNSSTTQNSSSSGTTTKKFKIATVGKVAGNAWFERMAEGVKQFAQDTGNNAYMLSPNQATSAEQAQIIQNLIAQKVDAIIVDPNDPAQLEPVLKRARAAGIVVIATEGAGMKNVDYDLEAFNNADYGKHFMDQLATDMGKKGNYVETVGGLNAVSHNQWVDASIAEQKAKYPNMNQVIQRIPTQESQEVAYQEALQALQAHPDITGFEGSAMTDVPGIALAVEKMGLQGKVHIVGTSLVSVAGKYLKDGTIDSISFWDPKIVGYVTDEIAVDVLEHKPIKSGMDLGKPGYNSVQIVDGNVIEGKAWIDVNKSNMDQYNY